MLLIISHVLVLVLFIEILGIVMVVQSEWNRKLVLLCKDVDTQHELIVIRDEYKDCIAFAQEDSNRFITHLCST